MFSFNARLRPDGTDHSCRNEGAGLAGAGSANSRLAGNGFSVCILSYANIGIGSHDVCDGAEASVRLAMFGGYRVATWEADGLHEVTDLLSSQGSFGGPYRMNELIARFDELRPAIEDRRHAGTVIDAGSVRIETPLPRPTNYLAAPLNYRAHKAEMSGPIASGGTSAKEMGFFVKASGSITGPSDPIELPNRPGRRFDHEAEIGFVIGREARGVDEGHAIDHVFGYTMLLDNTMRMTETEREERTLRKSFWSLNPVGPVIVTADEIPDPSRLTIELDVNGERRQSGSLDELILDIPGLIAQASAVLPLLPGDLYATGSPAGVGPIVPGDQVRISCPAIGEMQFAVTERAW
jgi:2-keto-4-pentenoate hydratase/2-oxohepta-3-ene-1,7-dioic acid hydratase in catechol pathway